LQYRSRYHVKLRQCKHGLTEERSCIYKVVNVVSPKLLKQPWGKPQSLTIPYYTT
jgi:hypothetical protein